MYLKYNLRIYNRALSDNEINALYNGSNSNNSTGWQKKESHITKFIDRHPSKVYRELNRNTSCVELKN